MSIKPMLNYTAVWVQLMNTLELSGNTLSGVTPNYLNTLQKNNNRVTNYKNNYSGRKSSK